MLWEKYFSLWSLKICPDAFAYSLIRVKLKTKMCHGRDDFQFNLFLFLYNMICNLLICYNMKHVPSPHLPSELIIELLLLL